MKKKLLQMTAVLSAALMLTGCTFGRTNNNPGPDPQPISSQTQNTNQPFTPGGGSVSLTAGKQGGMVVSAVPTEEQMSELSAAGCNLLAEITADSDGKENILISPVSVWMALGMTENGADKETLKQMEKIANGGVSSESLNMIMAYLSKKMTDSEDVSWNVANSVWLKDSDNPELDEKFAETVLAYYRAEVWKAAFDEGTVNDINDWVNSNTNGMIDKIIDRIGPNAVMYLINAIAFEADWAEQYEESQVREGWSFTNEDGSVSDVTMLASKEKRYFELGDGQGFVKPYKGNEFSFAAILPKEGISTSEYMDSIRRNNLDFAQAVREAEEENVVVKIPEFSMDYGTGLSNRYINMGMTEPFSNAADFSKIMSDGRNDLYIGEIYHKTHIEVDRMGTRAAAATAVEVRAKGMLVEEPPKEIVLDRPFVYAIVDNATGLPIFLGCQNTMNK